MRGRAAVEDFTICVGLLATLVDRQRLTLSPSTDLSVAVPAYCRRRVFQALLIWAK
jgi:hypothetical protein